MTWKNYLDRCVGMDMDRVSWGQFATTRSELTWRKLIKPLKISR